MWHGTIAAIVHGCPWIAMLPSCARKAPFHTPPLIRLPDSCGPQPVRYSLSNSLDRSQCPALLTMADQKDLQKRQAFTIQAYWGEGGVD